MTEQDNWDQHWSDYDASARYNPAQAFRRELITHWLMQHLAPLSPNNRLLDFGSGQGDLIASLISLFPRLEVAGIEKSAVGIERARNKAPDICFYQRDLLLPPSIDDTLLKWGNFAICSEVLEHVDEPEKFLTHASAYLNQAALLFITVPGGPRSAYDKHLGHRKHFTKHSLTQLISNSGLIPEKVCSTGFPFFNLYKIMVILRGTSLIKDASVEKTQQLSFAAKIALNVFSIVLKRRFNSNTGGWQMIAVARKPY